MENKLLVWKTAIVTFFTALGAALGTVNIKVGRQDRHSGAPSRDQPDSCAMSWGQRRPQKRNTVEVGQVGV